MFSAGAWDELRKKGGSDYALPLTRDQWVKSCMNYKPSIDSAVAVCKVLKDCGIKEVYSVGVGRGFVEYHIKRLRPDIRLVCTEYACHTVDRLRLLFPECDDVRLFDMKGSDWPKLGDNALCLLYRVDTGFDRDEWRSIFDQMAKAEIGHALLVATEFLTPVRFAKEYLRRTCDWILRRQLTFAGLLRTRGEFRRIAEPYYVVSEEKRFGLLDGFMLSRRK